MPVAVQTEVFEGPFDLLLHLILREQVDLYEVSLSAIVDAYLDELERIEDLDLDLATEFLLIAATLVELKARRLLPDDGGVDLDEELALWEERDVLLSRLLECKTFKDAAQVLRNLEADASRSHPRTAGLEERFADLAPDLLEGVTADHLRDAFLRATAPKPTPRVEMDHVAPIRLSVADAVEELVDELPRVGRIGFRALTASLVERLEVVVCDNASDDGTEAYMRAMRDDRVRYVRHERNIGANGNFNACLEHARGTYFVLLHDDDLLEPDFLELAIGALGGGDAGAVLAGVRRIDAHGRSTGEVPAPAPGLGGADLFMSWFARRFSFYFCSTLFHTERLRQAGGFASPEHLFQDVVAIARLVSRYGYASVATTGGSFRKHGANRGAASHTRRWVRDSLYLLDVLTEEFPSDAERLRAAGARYVSSTCYRYAAAESSLQQRRALFREIYHAFDRALPPWRFVLRQQRRHVRVSLGRLYRRVVPARETAA